MKFTVQVDDATAELDLSENADGTLSVEHEGKEYRLDLRQAGESPMYSLVMDGESFEVFVHPQERGWAVGFGNELFAVRARTGRLGVVGREAGAAAGGQLTIIAPMTGVVAAVRCSPGQEVQRGDVLLVLEAMKMNNEIRAPRDGTVKSVMVGAGQRVDQRAPLVVIE